jgi:crotonobetainyl-CoA:carnitine CoA-transferase CaiB-like acyl-CoA transferase
VHKAEDVVNDLHVKNRNMIVEIPAPMVSSNPSWCRATPSSSQDARGPGDPHAVGGEHTAEILAANWASTTTDSPSSAAPE